MESLSKIKNKWIRSLSVKKNRDREGYFVVEGTKMVEELLSIYPERVSMVISTSTEYSDTGVPCFHVESSEMKQLSSLKTPPETIAVVKMTTIQVLSTGLTIVLDGIQDPGNLGTIIRTADWFGVTSIVCSNDTVDVYNPKVIQASMGSLFRVHVRYQDLTSLLSNSELPIYGALLDGENAFETNFKEHAFLVIGNEGKGISPEILPLITHKVTIPKFGSAESLNAAMACGILLSRFRS